MMQLTNSRQRKMPFGNLIQPIYLILQKEILKTGVYLKKLPHATCPSK